MICKLMLHIKLLDDLQYWIDNWTPFNSSKRYNRFQLIGTRLYQNGNHESEKLADRARRLSITLPFELTERDIV